MSEMISQADHIDTYSPRLPILPTVDEELAKLQIIGLRFHDVRAKRISDVGAAEILAAAVLAFVSALRVGSTKELDTYWPLLSSSSLSLREADISHILFAWR